MFGFQHRSLPRLPVVASSAVAFLALVSLSACTSSQERAYETPTELCGAAVPADALEAFLPGGSEVSVRDTTPASRTYRCLVTVDKKEVLIASREWWEENDRVSDVVSLNHQMKEGDLREEDDLMYTERGAVAKVKDCPDRELGTGALFTSIEADAEGTGDADAMKKLITAYTASVGRSELCRG